MTDDDLPLAYVPDAPRHATPGADELRARIPGWGADLDHADRPAVPKMRYDRDASGAHWDFPERQAGGAGRERSIEHAFVTPVFGTAQPLHGVSGAIRRYAYERYSEGRAAHWLLLIAGDRVESAGAHLRSLATLRPDQPLTETGVTAELRAGASRSRRGRVDRSHTWTDPLLVGGPWVLGAVGVVAVVAKLAGRRR